MYYRAMKKISGFACIEKHELKAEVLERAARLLRMLAHPHRLKIVEILEREGACSVSRIIEEVGLPQPSVSLHLNQMKRIDMLESMRHGREVVYRIKDPRVLNLINCICNNNKEN